MAAKKSFGSFIIFVLIVIIIVAIFSIFTVRQGQEAMLLRLGKIVTKSSGKAKIFQPGLHFKTPLIENAVKFDVRLQTLDVQSSRILTSGQKYVLVDYYVKWRIANLPLYYTSTSNNSTQAEMLLQQKINDALRAEFGIHTLSEVISDSRKEIMNVLRTKAIESGKSLGISIIDVRIKRIDLPKEVSQSVYANMMSDREKAAAKYRAEGNKKAAIIRAKADATVTVTLAKAKADSAKIKGQGNKEAAEIYAKAYGKDSSFYAFYRSLLAYGNTFNNKQSILVLSPDNKFFKYFNNTGK
jgi:modulator of FtsH protease HflC